MNNGTYKGWQIISESSIYAGFMQAPETVMAPGKYCCLGWAYIENNPYHIIGHYGSTEGHGSSVYFIPQARVGIVSLDMLGNRFEKA